MNFSAEEREFYEDHLKWLRIEANILRKATANGFTEGKIEGETSKAKEIAIKMLKKYKEIEEIVEFTGLLAPEIQQLGSNSED